MTTLCFREDPGKGEGPPKMGHADGPDPAEPDLGLYPSTPCNIHSPQESPLYNLNTNTVTCDCAGTLAALTFTEASVHVYQPPMDAPVSQVFPLTTHKCPRQ